MNLTEAYEILELSGNASTQDIRKQYLKLVKLHHPDKGGDPKVFIKIQAAYEILKSMDSSAAVESFDIPIPPDLRKIIDDIVFSFRKQYEEAETYCISKFDSFRAGMLSHISSASRGELRKFNERFVSSWNDLVNGMFSKFNSDCKALIRKYDTWFEDTMDEVFEDMYKSELKSYKKSGRFYAHVSVLATAGFLIGFYAWQSPVEFEKNSFMDILRGLGMALSYSMASPLTWWIDCRSRKKSPQDVQVFDIVPFRLDSSVDFQGSKTLKRGRRGIAIAGYAGFGIANALTRGIGGPLLGGAAGLVIGGIADRIMNPTNKIREQIRIEFEKFSNSAKPELINHVLEVHQKLLSDLSEEIAANFEKRMRQTVLLLAKK